ncbi:hypothetical protein C8Q76DRAFT_799915 [Earliella scabrosa]|nr:hypothetical protein C8Q76DRAFT_799915 [Earliella scabrosa]
MSLKRGAARTGSGKARAFLVPVFTLSTEVESPGIRMGLELWSSRQQEGCTSSSDSRRRLVSLAYQKLVDPDAGDNEDDVFAPKRVDRDLDDLPGGDGILQTGYASMPK